MSIKYTNIELASCGVGKVNCFLITGKLKKKDFNAFIPIVESSIKIHGKINLLIELKDFHGWTVGAAWEDTKFGVRHFNHIENWPSSVINSGNETLQRSQKCLRTLKYGILINKWLTKHIVG